MVNLILAPEICHFMQQVCLAQAQECILEKSMMDNRKATIIGMNSSCIITRCLHFFDQFKTQNNISIKC